MRQEQHCRLKATDTEQWSNLNASETKVNKQGWGPRARGQLEDPKSWPWPWPLTVLALASKWSGLGLDASASSHRSVINVLNL